MKRCSKCGAEKPLAEFSRDKSRGRLRPQCKACRAESSRRYHANNRAVVLEKKRRYREANKEAEAQRSIRYREANRDKVAAYKRRWREANKDALAERRRLWCEANPDHNRLWREANPEKARVILHRSRSRKRNAEGSFTAADIDRQRKAQKGKCYYCGKKCKLTVEHLVPLDRGGTNWPDNIVLACKPCNSGKRNKLPHEYAKGGRLL
jgi:5-methylcytosine-specific restriction endonuclease McrA